MNKTRHMLKFVDGGEGIARRVAYLLSNTATDPGSPPAPGRAVFTPASSRAVFTPASSRAVFTLPGPQVDALAAALHSFGLATTEFL